MEKSSRKLEEKFWRREVGLKVCVKRRTKDGVDSLRKGGNFRKKEWSGRGEEPVWVPTCPGRANRGRKVSKTDREGRAREAEEDPERVAHGSHRPVALAEGSVLLDTAVSS